MIFVEVLGRRGEVLQRLRLEALPAFIGRGYDCEVIVADPLVEPRHARLALDASGAPVLEDLGSRNGLFRDGVRASASRIPVTGITLVRIGRTHLRIVPDGAAVPPALPDTESGGRLASLLATPRAVTAVNVVGWLAAATAFWCASTDRSALSTGAAEGLGAAVMVSGWAALWAVLGRANVQRFNFWSHTTAAWLFVIAALAAGAAGDYLVFLFPDTVAVALTPLALALLWVALLVRHLRLSTLLPWRTRLTVGAAAAGVVAALALLGGSLASDAAHEGTVPIAAIMKPVPAALVPAGGLERFLQRTDAMKAELDRPDGRE